MNQPFRGLARTSSRASRAGRFAYPALAVLGAGALVLAAGCSSGGGTNSAGHTSAAASQNPVAAIVTAARNSSRISSATVRMSEQSTGSSASASVNGTVEEQLKPTELFGMNLTETTGGQPTRLVAVIDGQVLYLKMAVLAKELGKPWIKISGAGASASTSSIGELLHGLQQINPAAQTAVFAAVQHASVVGKQVIEGVPTTHYSGYLKPSASLKAVPPALRKLVTPILKTMKGDVQFSVWIDAQHLVRKVTETETINGATVHTTALVSNINQPVHITLPPASQVATLPASALSG
jgi:hypothetical protein